MDAVELGRQRAAELHRLAVERGADPWRPLAFVLAEVEGRELDAEAVAPGAALLDSGHATYIAADALILYEDAESAFTRAFYIAHEIGHVELGDEVGVEPAREIDPSRSAEAAPVGMDRVVDYSRRQRREVQMDLFAREFLLPRAWARKLHIEDGMSATDIASRLGAPFEVVAQQLFDALLLPAVTPPTATGNQERRREPNSLQLAAASHRGPAYLLEAGPGTGKTQTLVTRVAGLLADGVDPRRILLLTFSNKAAGEMAARIAAVNAQAAATMWVGTFHAFGLDIIRRFHDQLALPKDLRMLDRTEAVELLEEVFPRLQLVHYRNLYDPTQNIADMLSAISRAKDEVVDPEQYEVLANAMLAGATTPEQIAAAQKAREVAAVYRTYEDLKRQHQCVDLGDLVSLPVHLVETNAAVREHLQGLYDHVLVDEYQDVNRSSVRLLKAFRSDGTNLWAVGDPKQSIYRFRGASSFNLRRFGNEDFPGGVRGKLDRSYRSVVEITSACSAFAKDMAAGGSIAALSPERAASGHLPEVILAGTSDEQTVVLADQIEAMVGAGYNYRDQAVLATGNERLATLAQDLERLGVPVLFLGSLFERAEVKDLVAYLSLLVDRRAMGLVRIACWPEFRMSLTDVGAILENLRATEDAGTGWVERAARLETVSAQGRAALAALTTALADFDETSGPWTVIATFLLDRSRTAARLTMSTGVAARTQAIAVWQFLNFLKSQPLGAGLPIVRLGERIRRLLRLSDERDMRQLPAAAQGINAVRLMTIHGAKGLEFPVVHLPGMNKGTIPRAASTPACPPPDGLVEGGTGTAGELIKAAHAEEQECLFYVAMSRAEDRLFFYAPTLDAAGRRRALSPYVDRLGSTVRKIERKPTRASPVAPENQAIGLVLQGRPTFTGAQMSLYESCPRRFFYTHILQVGGRRRVTPFMQMHEVVRAIYQRVIDGTVQVSDDASFHVHIREAMIVSGLAEHGYATHYQAFAVQLVRYFASSRAGHTAEVASDLSITVGGDQIVVRPDDVLIRPDGRRTLRRVQTGHRRSEEAKDVGAAAFVLAAKQAFPDAVVEMVHLADEETQAFELSQKELQNREMKLGNYIAQVRAGDFCPEPSSRGCPGCPAFFVCGALPDGSLVKQY